jgi:alpha-galactosidase
MIDNCASGGRRLDLEMMSRSLPLWRSDITTSANNGSTPDNVRALAYNLSWWLPLHGGGYPSYSSENTSLLYDMRSYFNGAQTRSSYDDETVIKQVIEEYNEYKDMLVGDYYILACGTDETGIETTNSAYEYYLPEEGRGFIMTFRPQESTEEETTYRLKGLDPDATYEIVVADSKDTLTMSGQKLMEQGLLCYYPETAFSMLIYFNKK